MTAEDPEAILEDDTQEAEPVRSGHAVLVVALGLTSVFLAAAALGTTSLPLAALVATVWVCGSGLRAAEVWASR